MAALAALHTLRHYALPLAASTALVAFWCLQCWLAGRRRGRRVHIHFAHDLWTIRCLRSGEIFVGRLRHAPYRSGYLVVLNFSSDDGGSHTEAFWRGAVTAEVFSRLHYAAAYLTDPASARSNSPMLRYTEEPPAAKTAMTMQVREGRQA